MRLALSVVLPIMGLCDCLAVWNMQRKLLRLLGSGRLHFRMLCLSLEYLASQGIVAPSVFEKVGHAQPCPVR